MSANPESDAEFDEPITQAVQTSLKRKHADHDSIEYVISSDAEEADDGGPALDAHDEIPVQTVQEPCGTTMVYLFFVLSSIR